jgi:hypothetical protein
MKKSECNKRYSGGQYLKALNGNALINLINFKPVKKTRLQGQNRPKMGTKPLDF